MVDGLDGLRHDAVVGGDDQDDDVRDLGATGTHGGKRLVTRGVDEVVGGDDQDDDVRDLGATGTHGGKRLVTRGVDEGDLATVDGDLGSADVLRDAAGLAAPDVGVADGVEQAGLTVVDMAHDGDHGRAGLEVLGRAS